jgi:iron complex outermembrane recepter protein
MINLKKLPSAIQFALFVGAASLVSGNAVAQDQDEEETEQQATTLDRIQVTGSRLRRADIEGATPVIVIDRESIDASGDVSVAEVLRDSTFASFGNFRPQSGSSAQSLATIDLRGLGSGRTLVLIDGRRAPTNPMAASSGTDVNAIPLSAVERIEILSDGASAIYGSDAIGGVVNIILRKDFNGVELRYGIANSDVVGGDLEDAAATVGVSGDRGRLIAGTSKTSRGMVFTRDQIGYTQGVSIYGNNYYAWGSGATIVPGFDCGAEGAFWYQANVNRCSFDFNSVAANEASIDNQAIFLMGDYQINDNWSVYSNANVTKVESFGRYAPVPGLVYVDDGTPQDINNGVRCDEATPDADGNCVSDGLGTYYFHRFAAAGNRDSNTRAINSDFLVGFQGQLTDRFGLEFGLRRSQYLFTDVGRGYIVSSIANEFANQGLYDFRDPYGADPDVLKGMTAQIGRDSYWKTDELFALTNFDVFEMAGGISNAVVGVEYLEHKYADQYDSLSEAGQILGSAGNSSAGTRNVASAYFEWLFPFTTAFDMTVAGRYDQYSDYGNDFSPKVSARFQPFDALTFRASWGQGFRAPGLDITTQLPSFSADPVRDPQSCLAAGAPSTCQLQVDTTYIANPDLSSEQSEQYSFGVIWSPTTWMDLSADYYHIEIEDVISAISAQSIVNMDLDPAQFGQIPQGLSITRAPNGRILAITAGYANQGFLETSGVDFRANTNFDLGTMGRMQNRLTVSYIDSYEITNLGQTNEFMGLIGQPDYRATLQNRWAIGDWTTTWGINHIADQSNAAGTVRVGSYTTHDLQFAYEAPWNATVAVGATNITNRYPQLVPYDGRPWNFYLYDAYGRTIYARYIQRF